MPTPMWTRRCAISRPPVGRAASHIADVTDPDAVAAMVKATVERFGRIDALVNNAAIRPEQSFAAMSFADWRRVLAVILDGAFLCSQACAPHIARAGGGSIVNIGGETGHRGAAGRAHVVTAKAGLAGMTKALALDLAPQNGSPSIASCRAASTPCGPDPSTPRNPSTGRPCRRSDIWERPKTWPRWCACFADPMHATSPDKRSMSTAALTCHDCHDDIAIVD